MPTPPDSEPNLEQRIAQLLREQPQRRAPRTLEARVLAQIAQRAAPWWQRSFGQWPGLARVSFVAVSLALAWLAVVGAMQLAALVGSVPWPEALTRTARMAHVASRLAAAGEVSLAAVLQQVPLWWIEAAAAFGVTLYVALFAVGAAAYRTLYCNR
jgi:hypothetical protein